MKKVSKLDEYLFDLNGYLIIENGLTKKELKDLNKILDKLKNLKNNEWAGYVHGHNYGGKEGLNLQQIYEAGKPFEKLIDHPSWINHMLHFVGGKNTFDQHHGPLFIDENFANIRGPGEAIGIHSGHHEGLQRNHYRFQEGKFHCGQVNILLALKDIGPGDGGTVIIPSSHKSNIRHGSAKRTNKGERRIVVYRYGPSWGFFRHPYRPSKKLLSNLTEFQKKIVMPHEQVLLPNN